MRGVNEGEATKSRFAMHFLRYGFAAEISVHILRIRGCPAQTATIDAGFRTFFGVGSTLQTNFVAAHLHKGYKRGSLIQGDTRESWVTACPLKIVMAEIRFDP